MKSSTSALAAIALIGFASLVQAGQLTESSKLWFSDGVLTNNGQQLVELLSNPTSLGFQQLPTHQAVSTPSDTDLSNSVLEQLFGELALAISQGSTQAEHENDWHIPKDDISLSALLVRLRNGESLTNVVRSISPSSSAYLQLLSAFRHYHSIDRKGGWPILAESDRIIRPGERHVDIELLRNRLRIEGDFAGGMQADPFYFGPALANALRQYQTRHGLLADGVLDSQTRTALRVPAHERLQQIQVNLERWRWLPRTLAGRRLWVNTAGAFAQLIDNNDVQLQLRTIAGRPYRATPSLVSSIERVVVNPSWGVPHRIAVQDLLPLQKKNKHFFAQKNIRVFSNRNGRSLEIERDSVDWSSVSADNFPYQLRQDPGKQNSMGRIKFVFANEFNVFLHDTPNKVLFELPNRNFSSGCVRVENPFELANAVLADHPHNLEKLEQLSRPGNSRSQSLQLEHALPIYLVYMTAWHDEQGRLHFTKDRYGRDREIASRLAQIESSQNLAAHTDV
ncbi:MAG: L,D-transpeptidase family protein [Pseudomonadota bacterium]